MRLDRGLDMGIPMSPLSCGISGKPEFRHRCGLGIPRAEEGRNTAQYCAAPEGNRTEQRGSWRAGFCHLRWGNLSPGSVG